MKRVDFSWTGSEDHAAGHAVFKYDGVIILSLVFSNFSEAHAVCAALDQCLKSGHEHGVKAAEAAMLYAVRNQL